MPNPMLRGEITRLQKQDLARRAARAWQFEDAATTAGVLSRVTGLFHSRRRRPLPDNACAPLPAALAQPSTDSPTGPA